MTVRRLPLVAAVVALLAGGAVADREEREPLSVAAPLANRALMPTAAPEGALSSTWFCVGATAVAGGGADGAISIANPTERPASGTVTVVPIEGESRSVPIAVEPYSVSVFVLRHAVQAPYAAALVDLDAGQVAAELVVRGSQESDATPCSSRASSRWYFADGVTAKDASLALSLFNPFPEDAIVDLSFSTDQGRASPSAFRPIVVPARTLVVRDIGEHVRRRNAVSTTVAVRTGRVVAAQTQTRSAAGAGLSVALGAPSLGRVWHFANGVVADGIDEHFAVSNPGAAEATVLFQVSLHEGIAEDFERTVPARGRIDVVLNEEVGVPRGVGHGTTVRSLDGVPVVVSRTLSFAAPAVQGGRADTLGARRAATRWLFPAGGTSATADEWLVVANPGSRATRITVAGLVGGEARALDGLTDIDVEPDRRRALRIGDHLRRDPMPLLVTSTGPVVVERALFTSGRAGVWAGVGIPLG